MADVTERIIESFLNGNWTEVFADRQVAGTGNSCPNMPDRMTELAAAGVPVGLLVGENARQYYAAADRECSGRGIMHSKVLRIGSVLMIGSANWTTRSKANWELTAVIDLNEDGCQQFEQWMVLFRSAAEPLAGQIESYRDRKANEAATKAAKASAPEPLAITYF